MDAVSGKGISESSPRDIFDMERKRKKKKEKKEGVVFVHAHYPNSNL
jgi:hypothetical protein